MRVLYPLIKGLAGGDVYFDRLSTVMNKLNIDTEIKCYPQILEVAPFLIKPLFKGFGSYNIIHSNIECGFAFRKGSKPLIVTAHHLVFDPAYQKYTSLSQKVYHKAVFCYIKKSLDVANCIVAVSKNTKRELERVFGITDVKVIYNGINTEIFKPLELSDDPHPNKIKLLFVGNLTKRKGADLLPEIMRNIDDRFVLYYTSGLRTTKEFSSKKMIPLKRLSLSELVKMYNLSDILIAPSRLEGFGYSVTEAMACGKPVVATNCSSLSELVDDGKGGFLCGMDDVDDFAEKIRLLAQDKELRQQMGKHNIERVLAKFSLREMGKKYKNIYEKLV